MSLLSVLFPSAFPALALAHFVALLSPGPDFFYWPVTPHDTGCAAAPGCAWGSLSATGCISCWQLSVGGSCASFPVVYGY